MELKVISTTYKCDAVELDNGIKVCEAKFNIRDGKVTDIDGANVEVSEEVAFTFSAWTSNDKMRISMRNVPEDVDGRAIIAAFIQAVEAEANQG